MLSLTVLREEYLFITNFIIRPTITQRITSCNKNPMITGVITLLRVRVTSLTNAFSYCDQIPFKGSYDKQNLQPRTHKPICSHEYLFANMHICLLPGFFL